MKDPGQILDSFRTDISSRNIYTSLLRQFDLEYPARNGNRKKYRLSGGGKRGQTAAVLSLCLVTGLTLGVGSAFADSEVPPDTAPPDLPPGKAKVKLEVPVGKSFEPERPVPEGPPPEKGKAAGPAERGQQVKSGGNQGKEPAPSERKTPPADLPKEQGKRREPEVSPAPGAEELPPLLDLPGELLGGQPPKSAGKEPESSSKASSGRERTVRKAQGVQVQRAESRKSFAGKSAASRPGKGNRTAATGSAKFTVSASSPRTVNGGKMPQTASGDLDGVIAGGLAALLGSLYILRRDGDETK